MSVTVNDRPAVGPLQSLAATSTGAGTAYVFKRPYRDWSVTTLVDGATAATVLFEGSVATSSDAVFEQIGSITAGTSGDTTRYNSTEGAVLSQVRCTLDAMSSSVATVYAWIGGA